MQAEEELLKKRFCQLADKAEEECRYLYTGFLNLAEQSLLQRTALACFPGIPYRIWGGYPGAERQLAALGGPELFGFEPEFPLVCLAIAPLQVKFADSLNHRDFLGAVLNLGVNRNTLGDILVAENTGYLFCLDSMAEYISENLSRVKHTTVSCQRVEGPPGKAGQSFRELSLVIASERLDALVAAVFKLSRSQSAGLFQEERVFVNGAKANGASLLPKAGDLVSVRGKGRFYYDGAVRDTKKGRKGVAVRLFE